jgi:acetyltransferase
MLDNFFNPESIAIVGASRTPGKVGHDIVNNIIQYGYGKAVYPINPHASTICGQKTYPSLLDIPGNVDLAVIVVPSQSVLEVIDQCGEKSIDSAVIITAGFKESGTEGARLERSLVGRAKKNGVRFIGPNCLGIIDTNLKMNASFAAGMPVRGGIGFFSQSGALCLAVLDRALPDGIGFSKFISLGNKSDISDTDIMLALAEDENTRVILGYIEGIDNGRAFMEVARCVSKKKPVIILKSGITGSGAKAASSHTGSLAGRESAFNAAFRQTGIIRAHTINDLFNYALAFANQPIPEGPNVTIITNSGGPGILAADACDKSDLQLLPLRKDLVDELRTFLPSVASFYNPIDILGDAGPDRYEKTLLTVLKDNKIDGIIIILTPTAVIDVDATAMAIATVSQGMDTPVLASFLGKQSVRTGIQTLMKYHVPNFSYPEEAVAAMNVMYHYNLWQEKPDKTYPNFSGVNRESQDIFQRVMEEKRSRLKDSEAQDVLKAYGFRFPKNYFARTSAEAIQAARNIGHPVVMKIISPQVIHKSDIGGVRLNLKNDDEIEKAFFEITTHARNIIPSAQIYGVMIQEMIKDGKEIIAGITKDPQFGHMVMFGMGGIYVEVLKDVSFRINPLSLEDAHDMIRETRTFPLLRGVRGEPEADLEAIENALLLLSQMASDFPYILEADINPLLVMERGKGIVAIDARFTIGGD